MESVYIPAWKYKSTFFSREEMGVVRVWTWVPTTWTQATGPSMQTDNTCTNFYVYCIFPKLPLIKSIAWMVAKWESWEQLMVFCYSLHGLCSRVGASLPRVSSHLSSLDLDLWSFLGPGINLNDSKVISMTFLGFWDQSFMSKAFMFFGWV